MRVGSSSHGLSLPGSRHGDAELVDGRLDVEERHVVLLPAHAGVAAARREPARLPVPVAGRVRSRSGRVRQRQPAPGDVADLDVGGYRSPATPRPQPAGCGNSSTVFSGSVSTMVGDQLRPLKVSRVASRRYRPGAGVGRVGEGGDRIAAAQVVAEVDERVDAGLDAAADRARGPLRPRAGTWASAGSRR